MNNATWIPEAGGYVYNGQVISQKPIYDSNGKQIITPTMELVNNSSTTNQTANANNVQNQTGATVSETATANKPNTNMQTAIGSLGTTNNNTATSGTAVSSPATNSPQTNAQVQDPVQKYITDYSTALANQDLGGQITALTELDKYTVSQGGTPQYSEIIGKLQSQNNEQVTNTVNEYANQIANATLAKNEDLANGLRQELADYKQTNNYASVLESKQAELETEYSFAYMQGINDITNGILSLLGQYSNFKYDPYSDPALQMAQGYAISSVKEQMNSTGMYYSSITQSAITKAINELIPVYEQMAKDEILENITLLQNTASYLLNLEQTQFNMWASQIELKIAQNQEKRAEIESAWNRVNNLGYVDNEASLILGVDVGTLSPEVRKAIMAEEAQIRADERNKTIQKELAKYTMDLNSQLALNKYYIENYGTYDEKVIESILNSQSDVKTDYTKAPNGTLSASQLIQIAINLKKQGMNQADILANIYPKAKDLTELDSAMAQAHIEDENTGTLEYIFDNEFKNKYGLNTYANILEIERGHNSPQELVDNSAIAIAKISTMKNEGFISEDEYKIMIKKYGEDSVAKVIDENAIKYSDKPSETQNALNNSINNITAYSSALYENESSFAKNMTVVMYKYLFDSIANSDVNDKNEFDYAWYPASWEGKWAKDVAIKEIIKKIEESNYYGNDTKDIVNELNAYKTKLKSDKLIG